MEFSHYNPSQIPMLVKKKGNLDYPSHWHSEIEISYVLEGQILAGVNSHSALLHQGDFVIVNPCDIHYFKADGENVIMMFFIDSKWLELNSFLDTGLSHFIQEDAIEPQALSFLKNMLQKIYNEFQAKETGYKEIIKGLFLQLYGSLRRSLIGSDLTDYTLYYSSIEMIHNVLDYIDINYAKPLTLGQIASISGYSIAHFSKIFKDVCGVSFITFLNRKRIDASERLIQEGDESLLNIAMICGFSSYRSFYRAYCQVKGHAPSKKIK